MIQLIGLDLETSGSDLSVGHRCIEIGLAVEGHGVYSVLVDWDWGHYPWSNDAERVHGISKQRLTRDGYPAAVADEKAAAWLRRGLMESSLEKRLNAWPVGWNIAGFDMPFIRADFPQLSSLLGYRTLDLNSACMTIGGPKRWRDLKSAVKSAAAEELERGDGAFSEFAGKGQSWHAAGYDAAAGLIAYRQIEQRLTDVGGPHFQTNIINKIKGVS